MINFKEEIAKIISQNIEGISKDEVASMVEIPQDEKMGDYAFPCFKLAKLMRKAPALIAKDIAEKISDNQLFDRVEQVNAYVNMFIAKESLLEDTISEAVIHSKNFGRSDEGEGKTVVIDYSSPNIAKPFHIGHIRSTVIGNAIYKLYDALGYDVVRVNHLGDYGTQFGKMICAYRKWGNKEDVEREPIKTLLSYYTKFHEEAEKDSSLEDEAREIFVKLENGNPEEVSLWQWFRDESLKEFNRVYDMLDITFDSYNGESFYSDKMGKVLEDLEEKGLIEESRGAKVIDLEDEGLGVALVAKSDGSTLYTTRDLAAAIYRKNTYNFYKNIYVVASQQNLHFRQLFAILDKMGYHWSKDCIHVPFGLVSLSEGTMSTRHGRVVFLEDVLNKAVEKTKEIILEKNPDNKDVDAIAKEVGIGAVIFQELSNSKIKDYVFNWDNVLNFDGETGPYVQYTYARCSSLLSKASEEDLEKAMEAKNIDYSYLKNDVSYNLAKLIYQYPDCVKEAAEKLEPSILTRHIVDIAQGFNKFYHDEHILVENSDEQVAKLALVIATKNTIKNGLGLLGIKCPERM